jgi:hypothetical protein
VILQRPRRLGEILRDALSLYVRDWRTYLVLTLLVVVPVDLVVSGIGAGELTAPYDASPSVGATAVSTLASVVVVVPLASAMVIAALLARGERREPSVRAAVQTGLDVFGPLVLVIVVTAIAIGVGLLLLVVPGILLAVRLSLVVPSVVADGRRGTEAFDRSWKLTEGSFWRVFGITVAINVAALLPLLLLSSLVAELARAADSQAVVLGASILLQAVTTPFVAIATTLLFFDLRERTAAPQAV